jgi:uncharacterized protein YegP (UPF0339 family)
MKGNPMWFQLYRDRSNEWRWRLKAQNGRIIADSAEGFINKNDCLGAIGLVKSAPIPTRFRSATCCRASGS